MRVGDLRDAGAHTRVIAQLFERTDDIQSAAAVDANDEQQLGTRN